MNKKVKSSVILRLIIGCVVIVFLVSGALVRKISISEPRFYGVTFSHTHAENLGLDYREVYRALLDDLGIRYLRIPAYWDRIERQKGQYDFSVLDWQIHEADLRGAELIIAVGRKLPRWPECHIPGWAERLDEKAQDEALLGYIKAVVERYRAEAVVSMWQVENEPFLPFGECPRFSKETLDREIAIVKSLDTRPIMTTDSGELSLWVRAAKRGDVFGTTMYRRVWNKYLGQFEYPLPPAFFRLKRALTEEFVGNDKPMVVIELQGEPWISKPIEHASIEEQYRAMDPEYFRETLEYASRSGFDVFYLWGGEWWYWLRERGHPEIWNIMREKIKSTTPS